MNPATWLQDYATAMNIQNASTLIATRYLPLMLENTARTWINNLPKNSINSWAEMKKVFIKNFERTCKRPATVEDIKRCTQKEGESTRRWSRRVADLINSAKNLHVGTVLSVLEDNTRFETLKQKLKRSHKDITSMSQLMSLITKYAKADSTKDDSDDEDDDKKNGKGKKKSPAQNNKRKGNGGSKLVANTSTSGGRGFKSQRGAYPRKKLTAAEILAQPCRIHSRHDKPAAHSVAECSELAELLKAKSANQKKDEGDKDIDDDDGMPRAVGTFHTFTGFDTRWEEKIIRRAVNATAPDVPQWLNWSEQPITWSRQDHPPKIDYPGKFALVVAPQVKGYILTKTLMDGGSSINILYYETFQHMGLTEASLLTSNTTFHGIVPGRKARSMGGVVLDVVFGSKKNFRLEKICFEVVAFKSTYHAILGWPAFAKFMARPCYAYLKLKLPGPNGNITIDGDGDKAIECEKGNAVFAESVIATEELERLKLSVDPNDMTITKKPTIDAKDKFQAAQETKRFELVEGDSSKTAVIGAHMDSA